MATATIPNLWPEIKVDAVSPYAILQAQAARLSQMTKGLLVAEVVLIGVGGKGKFYDFDIIAPVLNNYRHTLLSVKQVYEHTYPVRVESVADEEDKAEAQPFNEIFAAQLPPDLRASMQKTGQFSKRQDAGLIYTDTAFVEKVGEILQSPQAQAIIYSLLARSNEQKGTNKLEVAE